MGVVCVSIIKSEGSVPRKSGSKMVVDEHGNTFGSVGGGGLELLCINKALEVFKTHEGYIQHFDLSSVLENGKTMICGGNVTVEFSYVKSDEEVFNENEKKITVYIFGGGHVGRELVPVLEHLNFNVILLDNREEFASSERHPMASKCILCDYSNVSNYVQIKKGDYVAIMTHGHLSDSEILLQVMKTDASYIGCIGSRKKVAATKKYLSDNGISVSELEKLHSPIGLELYGDTPAEIAISIAAEMIKCRAE